MACQLPEIEIDELPIIIRDGRLEVGGDIKQAVCLAHVKVQISADSIDSWWLEQLSFVSPNLSESRHEITTTSLIRAESSHLDLWRQVERWLDEQWFFIEKIEMFIGEFNADAIIERNKRRQEQCV